MHLDSYKFRAKKKFTQFEFVSIGKRGSINKLIQFQSIGNANLYNLAFGDTTKNKNRLNDKIVSDNGDANKVLATVVKAIYLFFEHYPDAFILMKGNTPSRNRLYRLFLSKYFLMAGQDFNLLGAIGLRWQIFKPNMECDMFAIVKNK